MAIHMILQTLQTILIISIRSRARERGAQEERAITDMVSVHQEEYTKGHVALHCYEDGFTVGPLPKAQAWEQMKLHMMLEHGESPDMAFEQIPHNKVRTESGRKVPRVGRHGGFIGNDIFPDDAVSYPELGIAIPKFKKGATSIFDFSPAGLPDYGKFL